MGTPSTKMRFGTAPSQSPLPSLHFPEKLREYLDAIFASYLQAPDDASPEQLLNLLVAKHRREVRLGWEPSGSENRM